MFYDPAFARSLESLRTTLQDTPDLHALDRAADTLSRIGSQITAALEGAFLASAEPNAAA